MDKNLDMNSLVNYNSNSDSVTLTGYKNDTTSLTWDYWREWQYPIQDYWTYPVYINTPRYEDTYKKAFSIAKLLLKKKLLVSRKLVDFIGLVEEIVKEL